jgi:hypothetical protein
MRARAFTLLEVMVAMGLFFLAIFAILDLTAQSLRAARSLQVQIPDASTLAADLILTNALEEGVEFGDFGDLYPGFEWSREIYERETNGLYQVDFVISGLLAGRPYQSTNSLLLWRPQASRSRLPGLRR